MWPSEQDNHHGSSNNRAASSSSSSSRTSPSSTLLPRTSKRRTMEEVWRDISLCSLHHQERQLTPMNHHQRRSPATSPSFRATMLQDFLAGPLNRPHAVPPATADDVPRPRSSTTPLTQLSLSPSLEIQLMGSDARADSNSSGYNASFISPAFSGNMRRPPSPIGLFSFCSKEAISENPSASCDRRHKRMIKNRESAARSRARKQAYMNELELEVAHLLEENSRLRKELEELRSAMAAKHPKRNALQRSSTAPF
ncbi:hypothetical protein OPV22_002797 [Ensete ventricosum]|uniref:BZIP domain-containing protein n=1 Tax=Ensete ventricosum TaxID=4639 RepID=A0AAV8RZ29_ENSVE|nr:hypothetical protein OPV22_002797 [Ensete ventricosum]